MGKGLKFMKKFLSIITLACLLALGMALPAAAVGEETMLFAAFSPDAKDPTRVMILPKDVSRDIYFFTTTDGTEFPRITDGDYYLSEHDEAVEFSSTDGKNKVTGVKVTGEGAPARIKKVDSTLSPVDIKVVASRFEVKVDEGDWQTSQIELKVGDSVGALFRFGAQGVYDNEINNISVVPTSGLSFSDGRLSASAAGNYTLKYHSNGNEYSIPVSVSANSITIELPAQKDINIDMDFLHEKGYSDSGDVTLLVPAGNLGNVKCSAQLSDGTLTLKGTSATNSSMTGLTIDGSDVVVDSIHFTGAPGIDVKNAKTCTVTNCKFDQLPFQIHTSETQTAPTLVLTKNIYTGTEFATVVDYLGQEEGTWLASPKSKPETAYLNLGIHVNDEEDIVDNKVKTLNFFVDGSVGAVLSEKWDLKFRLPCAFENAYVACEGEKGEGVFESEAPSKYYTVIIAQSGKYTVVDGSYPKLSDKNEVYLNALDAKYLRKVTVDTSLSGATVTHNGVQVLASVNNKKLTFCTTEKNGSGTYKVVSATTTSKSTTTSRSYKYTYQDYYQVTPAGFTNAMRYVKDNLVTLNCTEAGSRSISLPVASMAAAAEKGYSVLVKTKNAELTLDAAALKSIAQQAKGTTVLLHYKSLNHKTLTTVGQASIQSHLAQFPGDNADLAFLVTATSDSETIEDLQMGTITLRIPFILLPGTEGMANTVYALQSESIAEARATTVADGHLTTTLLDLTEHMVFLTSQAPQSTEETTVPAGETMEPTVETIAETTQPETVPETTQPPVETEKQGGSPILTIVIVLGVVLVIGGGALGFLLLRRRFRK